MLELVGIIAGIVAAASILLFGSRGLVDLVRGISERRKHGDDGSPATEETVVAAVDQPTAPDIPETPQSLVADIPAASTGDVFVGRERELGELKAALEDALSGRGRVVALVGEPGIGKTRTAQELATYATLRGARVLWGRCYEEQGAPPYCPWRQAIHSYVRDTDPDQLRSEMGAGAVDIAGIVSEVGEKISSLQAARPLPPDQARFRLFESLTAFLRNASQKQPLVVILDNLHWSDEPSLKMMEFLSPELEASRVLVVATYRDADLTRRHPLSHTLGELAKERRFQRVLLRGLAFEDVVQYIEVTAGVEPPPGLADAVHTQTEGNALFVTEVVRLLMQEGDLEGSPETVEGQPPKEETWSLRIPEGVRAAVGRRLNRLSEQCNQVLTVAAVIGREFELGQLLRLSDSEGDSPDVLEEALKARVIEELPGELNRYQFTHSLTQNVLADELSSNQSIRLHARIAEDLEEMREAGAPGSAAELAYHYTEAAPVVGTEKLVQYSLLAGEHVLGDYAFEEAGSYFERALVAKEGQAIDRMTASLWFGLGRSQAALLQVQDAQTNLTRAFDYYQESEDITKAVEVAGYPVGAGNAGIPELVARALELVPPDSHEAGFLLSNRGFAIGMRMGDFDGAQKDFNHALAIARREEDMALEMWTLARAGRLDHFYLRAEECARKNEQAAELNTQVDDPNVEIYARVCVVAALVCVGNLEGAESNTEAMLDMAERTRYHNGMVTSLWMQAFVHLYKGDWQLVRAATDRGLALNPLHPGLLTARLIMEYTAGEGDGGEKYRAQVLGLIQSRPPGTLDCHLAVALADSMTGNQDHLNTTKDAARAELSSSTTTPFATMEANVALGLIAVWQADETACDEQYEALKPLRPLLAVEEYAFISMDRLLGLLARTMGRFGDAAGHFEDALTFCRDAGYRPELAWTCCDFADTLLQRNEEGDRDQASSLLDESLLISSDLGMRPLIERVNSRRDTLAA